MGFARSKLESGPMGHPTLPGAVGVNLHFHWQAGVTQQAWRHNPPRLTNNSHQVREQLR